MKKTLLLLTLATLATTFSTLAHAENFSINNNSFHHVRVTILEKENGEEKIKDQVCLSSHSTAEFQDYTPGQIYSVVAEYQYSYCDGPTRDLSNDFQMFGVDAQVDINENYMVFRAK